MHWRDQGGSGDEWGDKGVTLRRKSARAARGGGAQSSRGEVCCSREGLSRHFWGCVDFDDGMRLGL